MDFIKMNVAEFASLVGAVNKTIYKIIEKTEDEENKSNLQEIEQIITFYETINGRNVRMISTYPEQIEYYKKRFGKCTVNYSNCNDNVTENYSTFTQENVNQKVNMSQSQSLSEEIIDKILKVNEEFITRLDKKNEEIKKLQDDLIETKSKQLLLEDKGGRADLYFEEMKKMESKVKELENSKNQQAKEIQGYKDKIKYYIFTIIFIVTMVLIAIITYSITINLHSMDSNLPVEEQVYSSTITEEIKKLK